MPASFTSQADLPGGTFETHFTFAQTLTEAAKAAKNTLLVVSIPAIAKAAASVRTAAKSPTSRSAASADATRWTRLKNAIGRVESSWRPASAEEGFEIVRRRLFEPSSTGESHVARDLDGQGLHGPLPDAAAGVPAGCRDSDYEKRLKAAYPDPPGSLRPALPGLVHAGEVPAHPRRAAPDGRRHPLALGEAGPQPAHPAGEHPD